MCQALSSIPSTTERKEERKKEGEKERNKERKKKGGPMLNSPAFNHPPQLGTAKVSFILPSTVLPSQLP
jgi:hypothetical protein